MDTPLPFLFCLSQRAQFLIEKPIDRPPYRFNLSASFATALSFILYQTFSFSYSKTRIVSRPTSKCKVQRKVYPWSFERSIRSRRTSEHEYLAGLGFSLDTFLARTIDASTWVETHRCVPRCVRVRIRVYVCVYARLYDACVWCHCQRACNGKAIDTHETTTSDYIVSLALSKAN